MITKRLARSHARHPTSTSQEISLDKKVKVSFSRYSSPFSQRTRPVGYSERWSADVPLDPHASHPDMTSRHTHGGRVRANEGFSSYADMYDQQAAHLRAPLDRSEHHPPPPEPARTDAPLVAGRRSGRTVRWGERLEGTYDRAEFEAYPPPRRYAREPADLCRRDMDDGHGGDWVARKPSIPNGGGRAGVARLSRELDLRDRERGWNNDVTVPPPHVESLNSAESACEVGTAHFRRPLVAAHTDGRRKETGGVAKEKPEWDFGELTLEPASTLAYGSYGDSDGENERLQTAVRTTSTSTAARPTSMALKLAALKDRRAARRPTSRAALTREPPIEPPSLHENDRGFDNAGQSIRSALRREPEKAKGARGNQRRTTNLGGTWDEFGSTTRTVMRATGRAPARGSALAESEEVPDRFGGFTPPKSSREQGLSSGAARVTGGIGHLSLNLPPDMVGKIIPEGADVGPSVLSPCDTCGRRFNARALPVHQRSCAKVFAQKRKPFDVKSMRAEGTDLEEYQRKNGRYGGKGSAFAPPRASKKLTQRPDRARERTAGGKGKPIPKWKQQSELLRAGIRAGRGHDTVTDTAAFAQEDDLVPCPHCGRSFNETAAERHIPRCADIRAKPRRLVRGGGRGAHQNPSPSKVSDPLRRTRAF